MLGTDSTNGATHNGGTHERPDPAVTGTTAALADLLQRWAGLSVVERRTFQALCAEITLTSELIEGSVGGLTAQFSGLAETARRQGDLVDEVIEVAGAIDVGDRRIALAEVTRFVEAELSEAVGIMAQITGHAADMANALAGARTTLADSEAAIAELEAINSRANFLALNARIEAHRAGDAGRTFVVVASELNELSRSTNTMAARMRDQMHRVGGGIRQAHGVIEKIAAIDLSRHHDAHDLLGQMMRGLTRQSDRFAATLASAKACADAVSTSIGSAITGIQFQDRAKQHLDQIIDTLGVLERAHGTLEARSRDHGVHDDDPPDGVETAWIDEIIQRCKLGSVRQRFVERLVHGTAEATGTDHLEQGSIELF